MPIVHQDAVDSPSNPPTISRMAARRRIDNRPQLPQHRQISQKKWVAIASQPIPGLTAVIEAVRCVMAVFDRQMRSSPIPSTHRQP
jgi:hypothetical protein